MKTKAVRLYGKDDLRLEEFELPPIKDDEILAHVVSDSICMSSYKATKQGADHKRVPNNVHDHPVIIGHEFCGEIVQVGAKWKDRFTPGRKFAIQPAMPIHGKFDAPGYSYSFCGGDATYVIIPPEVMETDCLLEYNGEAYFYGSLAEPMSCIVGAFHASYHTRYGTYVHQMDIMPGGRMAILAGAGPMGLGMIDYAIHRERRPSLLVVTDVDEARLSRASSLLPPEEAEKHGVRLIYLNTRTVGDPEKVLLSFSEGKGFDDVFVMAPVQQVVEQADHILGHDGCLNFFAGPSDPSFSALFNFYNVHYSSTHIVGTSGGNTDDMRESLDLMARGIINPATMITHIGGLDAVAETTKHLPEIPGGKKLIYTNISLPLIAIADLMEHGKKDPVMAQLAEIVTRYNGLWNAEAEKFLLAHARPI